MTVSRSFPWRRMALAVSLVVASGGQAQPPPFSHARLDSVLGAVVDSAGWVDYASLARQPQLLSTYVDSLHHVSPRTAADRFPRPADELAFWINAYNALVLHAVAAAYPITSVTELGGLEGFFDRRRFVVGDDSLSLNAMENEIIRPRFRDPRIHFAVNCAARSCPALDQRAYRGDDLDAHLDRQARRFVTDERHLRLQDGRLHLSKIMAWYRQDFIDGLTLEAAGSSPGILTYLKRYLPPAQSRMLPESVPILFLDFDWRLNDQRRVSP